MTPLHIIAAALNSYGAKKSSNQLVESGKKSRGQIEEYYNKGTAYQQPYYDRGTEAFGRLGDMINNGAFDMKDQEYTAPQEQNYGQYNTPQFNFEADPGYQFRMQQGMGAVENSAAARGMQFSGATMKALARFGQGLASDEYDRAYSRYQDKRNFGFNQFTDNRDFLRNKYATDRAYGYNQFINRYNRQSTEIGNRYNRLAGLANTGMGAANTLSSMATNAGSQIANATQQIGNARAAGTMGTIQPWSNLANQTGNLIGAGMLNSVGGGGGMTGYMQPQQFAAATPTMYQSNPYQSPVTMNAQQPMPYYG